MNHILEDICRSVKDLQLLFVHLCASVYRAMPAEAGIRSWIPWSWSYR